MFEDAERLRRVWWRFGLLSSGISKNEATKSKNDVIGDGGETSGRGMKVKEGFAETSSDEGLDIIKVTETEGCCLSISLPSSTMEVKWPCDGYRTTMSAIVMRRVPCFCSQVTETLTDMIKEMKVYMVFRAHSTHLKLFGNAIVPCFLFFLFHFK